MRNNVKQYLAAIGSVLEKGALMPFLLAIADRISSQATATAGLVVSATTTTAKIGATAFAGVVNGVLVAIAASTDMPALTGLNISAGAYNVFCYFIDSAGVVTVLQGTEGATLAGVRFPEFPVNKALVGYLVVTYASAFTGGTTPLSTATTVYVSPVGAFDPTVLLG